MRRILFISGQAGTGKTTLARHVAHLLKKDMYIPVFLKFADPLYDLHNVIYQKLYEYGVPTPPKPNRILLQLLGTEWGRNTISEDMWVNIIRPRIDKTLEIPNTVVIVDDVRFPNELAMTFKYEMCRVMLTAVAMVRKNRAEKWSDKDHVSESAISPTDKHFDLTFDTTNSFLEDQAVRTYEWMKQKK